MKKSTFLLLFVFLGAAYIALTPILPPFASAAVKILPIILLMLGLLITRKSQACTAEWMLPFLALFFSACGDAAGNLPVSAQFIKMMLFFAIGHIFYISSFARHASPKVSKGKKAAEVLILLAYIALLSVVLIPKIDGTALKAGCIGYMTLLGISCIMAILQEREGRRTMLIGVMLFIISDSLLVIHKFMTPIPCRTVLVMGTYYAAQLLISLPLIFKGLKK